MTHYLLAIDSVHTAGAACDYLGDRLSAEDRVTALAVREDGSRDAADAANVAEIRLQADVTVDVREGDPATEIQSVAAAQGVEEVVVGTHGGAPGSGPEPGETTIAVLTGVEVPVIVVPVPQLDPSV